MTVRIKVICRSKQHDTGSPDQGTVALDAVTHGSSENEQYFSLTPAANVSLGILNPEAFAQFEPGKEYFIDFTPANPE
jgi:hypothetical protein